jgi:tetratricopeptide (TPR) repeat protein
MLGKAIASKAGWLERLDALTHKKPTPSTLGAPSLSSERVFEEYAAYLRRLSESHPLIITLDDLHWIDAASAGLLFHLSRRIADHPILVIGSYRQDVVSQGREGNRHPLEPVLNEVARYRGQVGIPLAPSSPAEGRAFVDALLDAEPNALDEAFRNSLWHHTEGHPLFLAELMRSMKDRGDLFQDPQGRWIAKDSIDWSTVPGRVDGVVGERIARLTPDERALLQTASVEGETFIAEVVAAVVKREPREVVGLLSASRDRAHGLVTSAGVSSTGQRRVSSYTFRHHLVQQYLYHSMDPASRAYAHEDVAKALTSLYGEDDERIIGQLAWHYRQAGISDAAFKYSILAGDQAAAVYANSDAVTHYTSAIDLLSSFPGNPDDVLHLFQARGRALELSGNPEAALDNYRAMRSLARERRNQPLEVASLAAMSALLAIPTMSHDPQEGERLALEALEMARAAGDRAAQARILWSLELIGLFTGHPEQAVAFGEESLACARDLGLREQVAYTLHDLSETYWMLGDREKVAAATAEARGLWEELGNQPMLANNVTVSARRSLVAGDLAQAEALAGEGLRIGRGIANLSAVSFAQTVLAMVALERGEVAAGLSALSEAVSAGEQANNGYAMTGIRSELALELARLGRKAEAVDMAQQALAEADGRFPSAREWVAGNLARIYLQSGETAKAEAAFPPSEDRLAEGRLHHGSAFGGVAIGMATVEVALARGDIQLAQRCAEQMIAYLTRLGARLYLRDAQRVLAQALMARNAFAEARVALQEALKTSQEIGSRRSLWRIFDTLASLEAVDGNASLADQLRSQAREAVDEVARNAGDPASKEAFLGMPSVKAVMAAEPRPVRP